MTFTITSNRLAARDVQAPSPALKEDGSSYRYRMFYDWNQHIIDADTLQECVTVLIPGYDVLDGDEKANARNQFIRQARITIQAAHISATDPEVAVALKPWEWDALTNSAPQKTAEDDLYVWSSSVPLVLNAAEYIPHTEYVKPVSHEGDYKNVSNLILLDPTTEKLFLETLSATGLVTFGTPDTAGFRA